MYVKPRQWIERIPIRHREDGTGDLIFHDWLMTELSWETYVNTAAWSWTPETLNDETYARWREHLTFRALLLRQQMLDRFPWLADLKKDEVHD